MSHGEANIWQPRTLIEVSGDTKRVEEKLISTALQTLFTLKDFVYVVGTGALEIHKNGLLLTKGTDWVEQTPTTFALTTIQAAGDIIVATGLVGITGDVDVRDTDIYVSNYQAIRDYAGTEITLYAQGQATLADGGEDFYQKVTGAAPGTHVDNNVNVIVPTGGDGSIAWIKRYDQINIDDFVADPTTASAGINSAAAIALSTGKKLVSNDTAITYVLNAGVPVNLEGLKWIDIKASIDTTALDAATIAINLGNMAQSTGGYWSFGPIISSNPAGVDIGTVVPQMRINGTKSITMYFQAIRSIQFFQTDEVTDPTKKRIANAYNSIYFSDRVPVFEVTGTARVVDPVWFNENTMYGGRFSKLFLRDKGYTHNHNRWLHPNFENSEVEINFEIGSSNRIEWARFENVSASVNGVKFSAKTDNNVIERTWISSLTAREAVQDPFGQMPIVDLGRNNSFRRKETADFHVHNVISYSSKDTVISSGVVATVDSSTSPKRGLFEQNTLIFVGDNIRPAIPGKVATVIPSAFAGIAESNLIPVKLGSIFSLLGQIRQGFWRFSVQLYDADGVELNLDALSIPSASYVGNGLYTTSDLSSTVSTNPLTFSVEVAGVSFLAIKLRTGSVSNTVVDYMTVDYHEPAEGHKPSAIFIDQSAKELFLSAAPTIGHAPMGTLVQTPSGTYDCSFEFTTQVTTEVANGATSVTVDDLTRDLPTTSIANGDFVGILLDDGTTHWDVVAGLAANTFTISALTSPAGTAGAKALAGAFVTFTRWDFTIATSLINGNTISGEDAGVSITTAADNVITGKLAANALTTGDNNVIEGKGAAEFSVALVNSVVVGFKAGPVVEGQFNTIVGQMSATLLAAGKQNTILGSNCGTDLTTGDNNWISGYLCTAGSATADNRIVMGINIAGTADDQFSFGSFGNVVSNDFGTDALWSRISDRNFKDNIKTDPLGLDFITRLRTVTHTWKPIEGAKINTKVIIHGMIAQEVEAALEEVGCETFNGHAIDSNGVHNLKLEAFIMPMINAIKELKAEIEELKSK